MTTRHYVPLSGSPDWAAGVVANRKLMLGEQRRSMGNAAFRNDGAVGKVWVDGEKEPLFKGISYGGDITVIYRTSSQASSGSKYYGVDFNTNFFRWFSTFYVETQNGVTHLSGYDGTQVLANNEIVIPVKDAGYSGIVYAFYADSGELLWVYQKLAIANLQYVVAVKIARTNGEALYTMEFPLIGYWFKWIAANFKGSRLVIGDYLRFDDPIVEIYWSYNRDGEGAITYSFDSSVYAASYPPIKQLSGPCAVAYDVLAEGTDPVVTIGVGGLKYGSAPALDYARYHMGDWSAGDYHAIVFDPRIKFYIAHESIGQRINNILVWDADASVYLDGIKVYGGVNVSRPLGAYNHRAGLAALYFPDENVVKVCNPSVKAWDDQKQEYGYEWTTVFKGLLTDIVPMPSLKTSNII